MEDIFYFFFQGVPFIPKSILYTCENRSIDGVQGCRTTYNFPFSYEVIFGMS